MIRLLCVFFALASACRDAPLPQAATPTFVTPKAASSMPGSAVQMRLGEALTWSVSFRGMRVGTAALQVGGEEGALRIESRFETIGLVDAVHPVRHRLVTSLMQGTSSDSNDLHRALGRVRAWARADASPATLKVLYGGSSYLLKLTQPQADSTLSRPTLRIEGEARSDANLLIEMTLWLTDDRERLPLQMTLSEKGQQVQVRLEDVDES